MVMKISILLISFMLVVSNFFGLTNPIVTNAQSVDTGTSDHYEVYPLPQSETYLDSHLTITDEVNVVSEDSIDEATMNFLKEILTSKSIHLTHSDEVISDKTNIILGTKDSKEYVDNYFHKNITYDQTVFNEIDSYVLTIDEALEDKGTIAILGEHTDAVYYALASLQIIFNQVPERQFKSVIYEDYADTKWRGFIEGFYGFPWSHEARKSLMRFGGQFKMNSYIFGPKDDKYHNEAWRTLYPVDELAKLKELVDVGIESKTEFIWAIHPGFNMINWNDYENERDILLTKLDQLYSIGVRQFGLFMDDISTGQALNERDKHVQLITDIANWGTDKGDVKPLVYTPPFYNQEWFGASTYLQELRNVPDNVEIMYTGKVVAGTVNSEDMQWPKDLHGRDPYVWLNWPVNDYIDSKLMLGKGEVLEPGTHQMSGIVSNPMGQANLSKIALFAVADFTWNVDDFNDDKSWQDSFKHIVPEVASELNTIAYHLSDPSPSEHGLVLGESENIKENLELFLSQFSKKESVVTVGNELIAEFNHVLEAIQTFKQKSQNREIVEEIKPWLNSLEKVVESSKHATQSAILLQDGDVESAWENLAIATSAMAQSKTYTVKKLDSPDVTVEAGAKRLVPFAEELIDQLDAPIYTSIDLDAVVPKPMSSSDSIQNLHHMVDGDKDTFAYIQSNQKNDDWYGIDYGKQIEINDIHILQGRNDNDHDIFHKGILEYSTDGEDWTAIGDEQSGYRIEVKDLDIEARYVRYRLTHAGVPGGKPDLWTAIREFVVNVNHGKENIYTNAQGFNDIKVEVRENAAEIVNAMNLTLQPSEYIGIQLPMIEYIVNIENESTATELTLESSENGVEWKKLESDEEYSASAYVRLINQTDQDVTFDVTKLSIEYNQFTEPVVSHNYDSIYQGKLTDIYEGEIGDKLWFGSMQHAGKYLAVDMGGIVDVNDVSVVIDEEEGDYFREGNLEISLDGQNWETVHTFNQPSDRAGNFPDHEDSYRYKRVQVDGKKARYVRLISTANHQVWFALNKIIVNEGLEKIGMDNPALQVDPEGETGNKVFQIIDQKLSTFYTPKGDQLSGYLSYKLANKTEISDLIILQSPTAISNAKVSIRDLTGWHEIGSLSKSYNTLDTSKFEHVLEVRVEWDGAIKPEIYEIIRIEKEKPTAPSINNASDLHSLVEMIEKEEDIAEVTTRSLKVHLMAIDRYEKQGSKKKVVKHMQSFKVLLDHQKDQKDISDTAHKALIEGADSLLEKWQ